MGADIHGCVEVKRHGWGWEYLLDIKPFISRNYLLFGTFFGVRNYWDTFPLFAFRGFPQHPDFKTKGEFYGEHEYYSEDFDEDKVNFDAIDHHSLTYVTLKELNSIPDEIKYINYHVKGKTDREIGENLLLWLYPDKLTNDEYDELSKGKTIEKEFEGKLYEFHIYSIRFDKLRHDTFDNFAEIRDLTRFMNLLMEKFDDVRMIVWFDN